MINRPHEINSFTLRSFFTDELGADIIFTTAANTLLNNITTTGEVLCYVQTDTDTPAFVVTNDGVGNVTLNGVACYTEALNGKYAYFFVRGGLPVGKYKALLVLRKKNGSGQWNPHLSSQEISFTVTDQAIVFT